MEQNTEWNSVCSIDALPENGLQPMEIRGIPVLVVNGKSRRLVVPRSCPHLSNDLTDGLFDGHTLTCTKHMWQWSVDEGGEAVGLAEAPLLCYETKEEGGQLFCRIRQELLYDHESE